ncbi:MAG: restriction endonuclease subunit S [Treponema sp.]|nr:restriction endonuclease subunit S [Treponema sp.]
MNNGKMKIENRISINFNELIEDCTKDGKKIPKNDYLAEGRFPIIDQGQEFIAGYSNDDSEIYSDVPAIIFGDHTRVFKYIDFPFFLGADGVKLLKAKQNVSYKYLYYFFSQAQFPNTGYARHFKWLKELQIPLPPIETQKQIAVTLDKVTKIISENKKLLEKYDLLIKSRFIEMFGDPVTNPMGWKKCAVIEEADCMVPGRDKPKSFTGQIPWITIDDLNLMGRTKISKKGLGLTETEIAEVKRNPIPAESVIMSCVGNLGLCSIAAIPLIINQQLHSFQCKKNLIPDFLMYSLTYQKPYMNMHANFTTVAYMNKTTCNSIPIIVPPIELQQQFATFVQQIDKSKFVVQKSLEKAETLYKSLMQEYFG